jgi:hypothetical protein
VRGIRSVYPGGFVGIRTKAGELIEIAGAYGLEASDRAILNILYQHAHDSGKLGQAGCEWEVPLSSLRFSAGHKDSERVRDSMDRLMRIVVTVPYVEAGEPRILKTHLLDFVDLASDEAGRRANCRFGIPKKLSPILLQSSRWGRIKAEIICAVGSVISRPPLKYSCIKASSVVG